MAQWHLAPALVTFRAQLNAAFPGRDTRSDGTIGDLRHQHEAGGSDHNPDASGTVCAFDGTHGPYWHVSLADAGVIATQLAECGDPRINYIIFSHRIWTKARGWHDYPVPPNASAHLEHFHLSVFHGDLANDGGEWDLPAFGGSPLVSVTDLVQGSPDSQPSAVTIPTVPPEEDEVSLYFRDSSNGTEVRVDGAWYSHLNPAQAQLETQFGAVFTDLDHATFFTKLSGYSQLPGQAPVLV